MLGTQEAHTIISIKWGYPYLNGLHYKGVYMGYPYHDLCLCAFLGPYNEVFSWCRISKTQVGVVFAVGVGV